MKTAPVVQRDGWFSPEVDFADFMAGWVNAGHGSGFSVAIDTTDEQRGALSFLWWQTDDEYWP